MPARQRPYELPPIGGNPSGGSAGTSPGSFSQPPQIGGPLSFSSPDTPGMPAPSDKTAWDFLPEAGHGREPVTQLEHARLGTVTPQMQRVAEREGHLSPEQVRDEVAAGRMVIPANVAHLAHRLDPMCIGRASRTKVNANLGASPVSSARRRLRRSGTPRRAGMPWTRPTAAPTPGWPAARTRTARPWRWGAATTATAAG